MGRMTDDTAARMERENEGEEKEEGKRKKIR